jgi:hypothetical protein
MLLLVAWLYVVAFGVRLGMVGVVFPDRDNRAVDSC